MEGKLSWMVIAIIGGVIVTVGIIVFFSFFGNAILEMLIGNQAVKAWVQLSAGIQKAYTTGGSVLPGWSLDWLDSYHARRWDFCHGGCNEIGRWCNYSREDSYPNEYRKDFDRLNAIFILNKSDYKSLRNKLTDRESNDTLDRCSNSKFCLCLGSISLNKNVFNQYFRISYIKEVLSGGINWNDRCYWGTASFITSKDDNYEHFLSSMKKIKLLQCTPIPADVKIKSGKKLYDLKIIQHFEGIIYLTREKSTNGVYIHLKYTPKSRTVYEKESGRTIYSGGGAFVI